MPTEAGLLRCAPGAGLVRCTSDVGLQRACEPAACPVCATDGPLAWRATFSGLIRNCYQYTFSGNPRSAQLIDDPNRTILLPYQSGTQSRCRWARGTVALPGPDEVDVQNYDGTDCTVPLDLRIGQVYCQLEIVARILPPPNPTTAELRLLYGCLISLGTFAEPNNFFGRAVVLTGFPATDCYAPRVLSNTVVLDLARGGTVTLEPVW